MWSTLGAAFEIDSQGELRLESRNFKSDGLDSTNDSNLSLFTRLQAQAKFTESRIRLKTSLVSRLGKVDSERDVFYFEDAFLEKDFGSLQIFAGLRTLNWSTSEAFHPSDIINSRNFDSQFENAEKFGEPMVGFSKQAGDFGFQAFYMPFLKGPKLTSSQNRLSFFPEGFSVVEESFVDSDGETKSGTAHQWALKTSMTKWGGDWSLYWVHHFDRSQPFVIATSASTLKPVFVEIDQVGLNLQQQISDFIFKFEGAARIFKENLVSNDFGLIPFETHTILSSGLEYTYGWNRGSETTFLSEFQFISDLGRAKRNLVNIFQRDGLLGLRHSFNDSLSRELLMIAIFDLELKKQIMISASYAQRLKDVWRFKTGFRYIDASSTTAVPSLSLSVFDQDHQVFFELSRFF
jgi:hypothetical protein